MRNAILRTGLTAACAFALAGCVSGPRYADSHGYNNSRNDDQHYDEGRHRDDRCDRCGNIERIEQVWVNDNRVGGGTVLGAIIGGAIGNTVGSGDGRRAATAAGVIAGGVVGHQVEKSNRDSQSAYSFDVRLDDGRYGHVTQLENSGLRVGDRVIIRNDQVFALR